MLVVAAIASAVVAACVVQLFFADRERALAQLDSAIGAQVDQVLDRMIAAAEARDAATLCSHFADNDRGMLVLDGRLILTRSAADERVRENFRGIAALRYRIDERHVVLLSRDVVLLAMSGSARVRLEDSREFDAPFAQTLVFTREHGEWRVFHSHQSAPR